MLFHILYFFLLLSLQTQLQFLGIFCCSFVPSIPLLFDSYKECLYSYFVLPWPMALGCLIGLAMVWDQGSMAMVSGSLIGPNQTRIYSRVLLGL